VFDGGQHGGHANIEHVDHEQLEIVGEREANLLTRSTCNLGQQKHGVANVHGTHMEAPSMGVGMVGVEFQPNPLGQKLEAMTWQPMKTQLLKKHYQLWGAMLKWKM
jgi:hypothetical protein